MSATDNPRSPRDPDGLDLPRAIDPPPYLEDRITQRLTHAGLLHRRRHPRWFAAAVAAAACFVAGLLVAPMIGPQRTATPSNEPRFLLLLYGGAPGASPNVDRDDSARAHVAWIAGLRQQGRAISGERLAQSRELIGFAGADSPNPGLEGFFVVASDSMDDAVRIARSSPHLSEGGRIVVQAIDTP